jgi:hypothetical protein
MEILCGESFCLCAELFVLVFFLPFFDEKRTKKDQKGRKKGRIHYEPNSLEIER